MAKTTMDKRSPASNPVDTEMYEYMIVEIPMELVDPQYRNCTIPVIEDFLRAQCDSVTPSTLVDPHRFRVSIGTGTTSMCVNFGRVPSSDNPQYYLSCANTSGSSHRGRKPLDQLLKSFVAKTLCKKGTDPDKLTFAVYWGKPSDL